MIQNVIQRFSVNGDGHPFEMGKVGLTHLARLMVDFEHHFFGLTLGGFPLRHPTLHRSEFVVVAVGVILLQGLKER